MAARFATRASPAMVERVAGWITTDPWWDTCDSLARHSAGLLVARHPAQRRTMDRWLSGNDLWLTRAAIIHMGGWKEAIDREWVFAACLSHAEDPEFFIRKAIGWILRDLAWVDGEAVAAFVEGPGAVLSNLSKREALKNLSGPRSAARLRRATRTAAPGTDSAHQRINRGSGGPNRRS